MHHDYFLLTKVPTFFFLKKKFSLEIVSRLFVLRLKALSPLQENGIVNTGHQKKKKKKKKIQWQDN